MAGDYCSCMAGPQAKACLKVDNVRVEHAVNFNGLLDIAGGGDRGITDPDDECRGAFIPTGTDGYFPACFAWWRLAGGNVPACRDTGRGKSGATQ